MTGFELRHVAGQLRYSSRFVEACMTVWVRGLPGGGFVEVVLPHHITLEEWERLDREQYREQLWQRVIRERLWEPVVQAEEQAEAAIDLAISVLVGQDITAFRRG